MALGETLFRSHLIDVLKDIHFELKRANELREIENEIMREGNKSFYQEQQILEETVDDAIGHAKNINNNFNALNRKVEESEKEEVYDNH